MLPAKADALTGAAEVCREYLGILNTGLEVFNFLWPFNSKPWEEQRLGAVPIAVVKNLLDAHTSLQLQVTKLKAENSRHIDKSLGDYWSWQGDGTDALESLVCPVLIPADVLLRMLTGMKDLATLITMMKLNKSFTAVELDGLLGVIKQATGEAVKA
jgi:hypothetical protein